MKVLLGLKLTSDDLMRTEVIALKNAFNVKQLIVMTDKKYKTEIVGAKYFYLNSAISKLPILRVFARIPIMLKICLKEKIDLLICYHLTSYGFAGFIISRVLRIPLSVHFLGKDIDILCRLPIFGNLLIRAAKSIELLTVQGKNSKSFLKKKKLKNVCIIPTAYDANKFQPRQNSIKYHLISVGRLSKEKRIDRFIEVVYIIRKKKDSIKALIVGSGPQEKKILRMINNYGLNDCIHCTGWKNDVSKFLSLAKIFVLTSDNEQLPSSLLEAMAMGLVPVVSNVGNLSDVVDIYSTIDIKNNCKQIFADKILELLADNNLYKKLSTNSINKVKKFTTEANSIRWEYVIDNLKEQKSSKRSIGKY